jgi:hypothetical protein
MEPAGSPGAIIPELASPSFDEDDLPVFVTDTDGAGALPFERKA